MYDIIIVGAGTSGFEFAQNLYDQAVELGVEIKFEKVIQIKEQESNKIVITESAQYECKTIILATGAKKRPLGVQNEDKFIGRGVSYCATCDGMFFKGKIVAVAGGGNTALEDATFLSSYCERVFMVNRGQEFKGEKTLIEGLESKDNVEFIFNANIVKIEGGDRLERIIIENKEVGWVRNLDISGLFVAVGQIPQNEEFADVVKLDEKGYIVANEDCKTNVKGIFVAGDGRTKSIRQLTTAAADGTVAALAACEMLG